MGLVYERRAGSIVLALESEQWWAMNFPLHGYNEALITYVLAAHEEDILLSKKYIIMDGQSNFF